MMQTSTPPAPRPDLPAADTPPELSLVVPALDEQDNVIPLANEVYTHLVAQGITTELIIVDDGSTDATPDRLAELAGRYDWVRPLRRDKSQGQSAATFAGIAAARGRYIGFLDADLQNDPADLPAMVEMLRQGRADMVQGMRLCRQDTPVRRVTSWVGRMSRRWLLGDAIRDTGCSTRVMKAEYARRLPLIFKGMHRFMPVYARMLGAAVLEVEVNHRPRVAGMAKYGILNRGLVGLADCLVMRWMLRRYRHPAVTPIAPVQPATGSSSSTGQSS